MNERMRVALVTGGAIRVGRAIVTELASAGWEIAFTYHTSADAARTLADELRAMGRKVVGIEADLARPDARPRVIARVEAELGGLDALINSAAVFTRTRIADLSEEQFADVLRTNLEAPVFLALAAARLLRARRGAIVNVADIYAAFPLRDYLAYSVSKAALVAATRSLAVELAPEVRVNAVAPGIAIFPPDYTEAVRQRMLSHTLLQREGGGEEIARAVRYLLEGTDTMTGQVLTLDGGRTIAL
ncbi:MAG: SDR family oxidoreductase [Thermoanaerobaculales bacterium]